jgi:hypothetical protein
MGVAGASGARGHPRANCLGLGSETGSNPGQLAAEDERQRTLLRSMSSWPPGYLTMRKAVVAFALAPPAMARAVIVRR